MGRFYIHAVRWASILGAGLSFLFGSTIVPWLIALSLWAVRHTPWSANPPGPFPNSSLLFSSPNMRFGALWLGYYLITYLWSLYGPFFGKYARYRSIYLFTPQKAPLSRGWPGEQKWELVECCYQRYREALKRYNPQPVQLKTPPGFYYRKGNELEWEGMIPVLPEELLTPEMIHMLLPLLAHHLAYYHSPDKKLQDKWESSPDHSSWWLIMTGNFLWLSVQIKLLAHWEKWKISRVHEADTFAHYLGEGETLEHWLRREQAKLEHARKPDYQVPSLIERIGHLEALRKWEYRQMRELGLIPTEPPLVRDNILLQLNRGNETDRSKQ